MSESANRRYSSLPFPRYSYIPGSGTPHPVSDPAGHMHGQVHQAPLPLVPSHWQKNETYLYAVDLFNHGYYWEAHEAWESLWHAAGRHGQIADFLKGLIKLAAAGVKSREGNPAGVARHLARGCELLHSGETTAFCGVEVHALLGEIKQTIGSPNAEFALTLELRSPAA